jgi:hypothetical protein
MQRGGVANGQKVSRESGKQRNFAGGKTNKRNKQVLCVEDFLCSFFYYYYFFFL